MKTDAAGGTSANDRANDHLEERLSSRFTVELGAPSGTIRTCARGNWIRRWGSGAGRSWRGSCRRSSAVAVLAVAGLIGAGLASGQAPTGGSRRSSSVANRQWRDPQPDRRRASLRVTDQAEWQNLSGSFLLAGYVFREMRLSGAVRGAVTGNWTSFLNAAGSGLGQRPVGSTSGGLKVATLGSTELGGWIDQSGFGPAIVARVHTHDAGGGAVASADQADCQAVDRGRGGRLACGADADRR